MSDIDPVLTSVSEGPAVVTLNRPDRKNAWTVGMQSAYFQVLQSLSADPTVRVADPDARLSIAFARRGLPAMHGAEWLLDRIVDASVAHELLLTGRTFNGTEAARLNFVTECTSSPLKGVREIAADMAAHCSPTSMAHIEGQLWTTRERTLAESVVAVDAVIDDFLSATDVTEGITSFVERRAPRFTDLATRVPNSVREKP